MKQRLAIVLTALAALCAASSVVASESLARSKNCLACHQTDGKLVGPSYRDIATKYSDKDADRLVHSIRNGSKGHWGSVPMPPNKRVNEDEARKLAAWILSLK